MELTKPQLHKKLWIANNREKHNSNQRAWRKRNKVNRTQRNKELRALRVQRDPDCRKREYQNAKKKLRAEIIAAYGGKCACCGEATEEFLTMDHIGGRGCHHRKEVGTKLYRLLRRSGFPKDQFRLLCMNCNFSFGMKGYCPHQRKLERVA